MRPQASQQIPELAGNARELSRTAETATSAVNDAGSSEAPRGDDARPLLARERTDESFSLTGAFSRARMVTRALPQTG